MLTLIFFSPMLECALCVCLCVQVSGFSHLTWIVLGDACDDSLKRDIREKKLRVQLEHQESLNTNLYGDFIKFKLSNNFFFLIKCETRFDGLK